MSWRRKWHPLQYSCLENPMKRGACRATVHGLSKKSQTCLSDLACTQAASRACALLMSGGVLCNKNQSRAPCFWSKNWHILSRWEKKWIWEYFGYLVILRVTYKAKVEGQHMSEARHIFSHGIYLDVFSLNVQLQGWVVMLHESVSHHWCQSSWHETW